MALHHLKRDQVFNGKRFSVIQDFDRFRLVHRTRHMIDGKSVTRVKWEEELAKAQDSATNSEPPKA